VCVPVSALADAITATAEDARELPFPAAMVGHVADGNFHWICPVDVDSEAEQAALREFVDRMVRHAQAAGGTCTGEHGVGIGKREYLAGQTGAAAVEAMRAVKRALDPQGILNPGKVLPDA
jgi:D-lactate dehydrogenase (cytochrome)